VAIAEDRRSLRGVIPVADIGSAMRTLQSNCLKWLRTHALVFRNSQRIGSS